MTPEEIEIQQKQQLIHQLEEQLADLQTEHANTCLAVEHFQRRYLEVMQPYYSRLDRWNLRVACTGLVVDRLREVRDGLREVPDDPFEWEAHSVEEARIQWSQSQIVESDTLEEPIRTSTTPHEASTAKELYRLLAKRYHPDLVTDPDTRVARTDMMVEINQAYQRQDLAALRDLLQREPMPEPTQESFGDVLVRLVRRLSHLQNQIQSARKQLLQEQQSELMQLYLQCQQISESMGDPFAVLKQSVEEQIQRTKLEWMHMRARESKLWSEVDR